MRDLITSEDHAPFGRRASLSQLPELPSLSLSLSALRRYQVHPFQLGGRPFPIGRPPGLSSGSHDHQSSSCHYPMLRAVGYAGRAINTMTRIRRRRCGLPQFQTGEGGGDGRAGALSCASFIGLDGFFSSCVQCTAMVGEYFCRCSRTSRVY